MERIPKNSHIRFHCDACGRILRSKEIYEGISGRCACGAAVRVPFVHPRPSPDNPLQGLTIAGCRIDSVIGRGSSATVHKAHHLTLDIPVAVKILNQGPGRPESVTDEGFLEEARIVARLDHPNIVGIINAGEESGHRFIVTRYVRGTSLGRMLRRKEEVSLPDLVLIFADVCKALWFAHKRLIVHGDVKPDHILITPLHRAVLIDFGLVRGLKDYKAGTADRRAMGTPLYMAPERARGEETYDVRSDIYSLGATMFHALTGRPPFDAPTIVEILRKHAEEPLEPPASLMPQVPGRISDIVMRAMEKDPNDRFQTVGEVGLELLAVGEWLKSRR